MYLTDTLNVVSPFDTIVDTSAMICTFSILLTRADPNYVNKKILESPCFQGFSRIKRTARSGIEPLILP